MTEKINVGKGEVKGNLKNVKQKYEVNFILKDKEKGLSEKVELAILLEKQDGDRYAYRSLRFEDDRELKKLIEDLIVAYKMLLEAKYEEITLKLLKVSDGNSFRNLMLR